MPELTPAESLRQAANDIAFHRVELADAERRLLRAEKKMREAGQIEEARVIAQVASGGLVTLD